MNGLVTAGRPAGALLDTQSVVGAADEKLAPADLLEVAFQTEVGVAHGQQLGIDRAVRSMAGRASLAHGLVLEDERPALGGMAAEAAFVFGEERGAAAGVNGAFVRRMAVGATQFVLGHGMVGGKTELAAHIGVALEANRFRGAGRRTATRAPKLPELGRPDVKL